MLKKTTLALLLSSLASFTVNAYADSNMHIVVAPHCLIKKMDVPYKTLSTNKQLALIEINEKGIDQLIENKHPQKELCGGFMDVTEAWHEYRQYHHGHTAQAFLSDYTPAAEKKIGKTAYSIKYPQQVNQVLTKLNMQRIWNSLTTFSAFYDRYSRTSNGVKAAEWIKNQMTTIANGRPDVKIYYVQTAGYIQPSVVAKFGTSNEPGIVIGAHMDTTSGFKPGADDDGTGSMTVLETANVLLNSGLKFKKPIYFIWYAAEEVGLVGSQNVVKDFKAKNIPVSEVMQLDMTGYPDAANPTALWLMDDYVSAPLTTYIEALINTYVKRPIKHDRCGYACSDHATWTKNGYASVMPFEASMRTYNPSIHSSRDTMEKLVLAHMTDYAKLALSFAVELAEPIP